MVKYVLLERSFCLMSIPFVKCSEMSGENLQKNGMFLSENILWLKYNKRDIMSIFYCMLAFSDAIWVLLF